MSIECCWKDWLQRNDKDARVEIKNISCHCFIDTLFQKYTKILKMRWSICWATHADSEWTINSQISCLTEGLLSLISPLNIIDQTIQNHCWALQKMLPNKSKFSLCIVFFSPNLKTLTPTHWLISCWTLNHRYDHIGSMYCCKLCDKTGLAPQYSSSYFRGGQYNI